ncbi:MAG: ComEC/Rec2 family competence protein [Acholeplasmataceae bacterium]|nr:ComEC/Rec2 family competence protein [Acholeplasmataceae bacterium]
MKRLKTLLPFNYFHYYAFSILIALISYQNLLFCGLYLLFYYLIRNYQHKIKVILVGVSFFIFLLVFDKVEKPKPHGNLFIVVAKSERDGYYRYFVREKRTKYLLCSNEEYQVGDLLEIAFELKEFKTERRPASFNERNYYYSLKIYYQLKALKITKVGERFVLSKIKASLLNYFKSYPPLTKGYIEALLLAENDFSGDFKKSLSLMGISHLFALSGMHLNFFIVLLERLFKSSNKKEVIILVILTIYVIVLGFPISLLRAYLSYLFLMMFKEDGISSLDALSLAFMVLLINPYRCYHTSFILTFLVSFFIIVAGKGFLKTAIVAFLVSLPFLSNFNGGILIISLPFSLLISYLFPIFIFPLTLVSVIPYCSYLSEPLFSSLNNFIAFFQGGLFIKFPYFKLYAISLYLVVIVFVLLAQEKEKMIRRGGYLVLFLLLAYFYPYYNFQGYLYFLDVGQGDATFISRPFNQANILIDANEGTYQFLKTRGEIEIDYFFITHGDLDHCRDAVKILSEFKVANLYLNAYDDSLIVNELEHFNLKRTKDDVFYCGDVLIEVLGPCKDYHNVNDNSLVLRLEIDDKSYLFTGDSSQRRERDLLSYREKLRSDYLHVGHHGSNDATTLDFLKMVNPAYAIISSGVNNYRHPHPEVLERLNAFGVEIMALKETQTITIKKYRFPNFKAGFVIQNSNFSV